MDINALKQGLSVSLNDSVNVRLICQDDLADIITMLDDERVTEYLFFAPAPVDVYEGYFNPLIEESMQAVEAGNWPASPIFIVRDNVGSYMGMVGVAAVMLLEGNFEVGYQLPHASWGKGLGTLLCQFATALVFEHLNGHKVTADCYASNIASYRIMEKSGYEREGMQCAYYLRGDGYDDRVLYGMTKSQYLEQK